MDSDAIVVLLVGDSKVGKTSIMNRFVYDDFEHTYMATICLDTKRKTMQHNGKNLIQMAIFDPSGNKKYRELTMNMCKNRANAVILTFDLTERSSFDGLNSWLTAIEKSKTDAKNIYVILVGTKSDMMENIVINQDEINTLCSQHNNIEYIKTSVKENIGIDNVFKRICDNVHLNP